MPTVLFLCTGNYYRSRFAEILFNHLAWHRHAISPGKPLPPASASFPTAPTTPAPSPSTPTPPSSPAAFHCHRFPQWAMGNRQWAIPSNPSPDSRFPAARIRLSSATPPSHRSRPRRRPPHHRPQRIWNTAPLMENLHPTYADKITYWNIHDLDCAIPAESLACLESRLRALLRAIP